MAFVYMAQAPRPRERGRETLIHSTFHGPNAWTVNINAGVRIGGMPNAQWASESLDYMSGPQEKGIWHMDSAQAFPVLLRV
jgi:hypothetical protein